MEFKQSAMKREKSQLHRPNINLSKLGVTPVKLTLAGVLTIVWVAVLVMNLTGEDDSAVVVSRIEETTGNLSTPVPNHDVRKIGTKDVALSQTRRPRAWPKMSLNDVQIYNPFRLPTALDVRESGTSGALQDGAKQQEEIQIRRDRLLAELRHQGVKLVLISDQDHVAKIGARDVRVGDYIEQFRVEDIRTDGVVLVERDDKQR